MVIVELDRKNLRILGDLVHRCEIPLEETLTGRTNPGFEIVASAQYILADIGQRDDGFGAHWRRRSDLRSSSIVSVASSPRS